MNGLRGKRRRGFVDAAVMIAAGIAMLVAAGKMGDTGGDTDAGMRLIGAAILTAGAAWWAVNLWRARQDSTE